MMKQILFLCLSLLLTQSLLARTPAIMTHENFVHLTDSEKEKVIIQTMELIVELESQYKHEQVSSSETSKTLLKLYSFLHTVLINSAHAQSNSSYKTWEQRGADFVKLMKTKDRCIYAGWVSTIVNEVCVHPSTAQKKVNGKWIIDREVREAYRNTAKGGCEKAGLNKIACNPVIFGFEKLNSSEASSTPYCVNAGMGPAHNSALECMQKATKSEKNIDFIKKKLENNPEITNGVHQFVTRACLCDGDAGNINKKYHDYMRPHRTCYGLMNTIADTYGQCSVVEDKPIYDSFKEIHKSLSKDIIMSTKRVNETDIAYKGFLEESFKKDEIASFCGTTPSADTPPSPGKDPEKKDDPTPGNVCKCKPIKDSNQLDCVATILIDGKEPLKHDFKLSQDGKLELDLASVKEAKLTGKLACTMDEEENDNTVACKEMKLEVKDGKVSASAIYELTDHKVKPDAKPVWSPETATFDDKTASFELPKDAESFTASLSLELDGGKNLACSGEWKKDPNSDSGKDKPKIEATKESETPANIVAKAKITVLKDKKPEVVDKVDGYTIVWYRKGAANLDLPKVDLTPKKDEKKDGGLKGVAKDGGEAATEPAVDPAKVKPLPEKEDPNKVKIAEGTPTVTAPRSAKGDYEVCAELQGKGEVISGGCVKVPKIATPMMRNGGQQYMPNRNQTAAPGMR